jgi:hypothetical protein
LTIKSAQRTKNSSQFSAQQFTVKDPERKPLLLTTDCPLLTALLADSPFFPARIQSRAECSRPPSASRAPYGELTTDD